MEPDTAAATTERAPVASDPTEAPESSDAAGDVSASAAGWGAGRIAVLVLACAFLAGAVGYLVGDRTSGPPDSDVDTGFLQDMATHHDQAVSMASVTTASASDPLIRDMAREVLIEQRYELGLMDAYLEARDETRGEEDREVMGWMGLPVPLADMPGYATPEQLDELREADPDEQNELFLELMIAHHRGGVDMAEFAARNAEDPRVRRLAEVMADVQSKEIREYEIALAELQGASGG